MFKFSQLRIHNKLRILGFLSVLSLIVIGVFSNYFYNTGKVLSLIINAERVTGNKLQEGIEDYYQYRITGNSELLDIAIQNLDTANTMAHHFGIIDTILQSSKKEYIQLLYNTYKVAFDYDIKNAKLMASRTSFLLLLKPEELIRAQAVAYKGYQLGERIKNNILAQRNNNEVDLNKLVKDIELMRIFYNDFSYAITDLTQFTNKLLQIGIIILVNALILLMIIIVTLISRSVTRPVAKIVESVGKISHGDLSIKLEGNDKNEIGALSSALNKMVVQLKISHDKSQLESWFKTGINELNEELSGDQELKDISANAINFMMKYLHSQLGSLHLFDRDSNLLKLLWASGFNRSKLKNKIKPGEGIIGQVADSKELITIQDIPNELYTSYSSSGEFKPKQIIVAPLLFNENLIGVLELSSTSLYSENEINFIKEASEIIAINLNSSESILKTNELLQKTQDQANELQVQQEELRVANEELVEHTKVLTENEKKLQVQQEELRVANEELEERTRQLEVQKEDVSKKNSELTKIKEELEVKAKELQLSSQYKSEFLANMSHELRTPLNSLLILSNMLAKNKKGNLTKDQVQSANIIHKSGSDLLYLINDVLDLSKIEAGKVTIELETVKTTDLKEDIAMNFNASAEDKNLGFEVKIENGFPAELKTDRYRLMQILKNLLSNAFKFTSKGYVNVDFEVTPKNIKFKSSNLNANNTCCIKVSDTGVGIPKEKLEAIFEAFQQADGSISRKFGGTGLGLSISRELIKMLGGEIQLESEINKGSTFFVYLPTSDIPKSGTYQKEVNTSNKTEENRTSESENQYKVEEKPAIEIVESEPDYTEDDHVVLIIHPSKEQATKFQQQTKAKNYESVIATNIEDGIMLAEKYHPKAIMLAVKLAGKNDENYNKLKSHPAISKLPVHLISPIDSEENFEKSDLQTLEATDFTEALNSLENDFISTSKKILIIEDNETTLNVIKQLLNEMDIAIEEARFAEEAFKMMSNKQFDCIILDLGLPDYSGKELIEKLKQNNIVIPKVIVYTGKDMSKDEIDDINKFADTIILKGLKSDERLMDEVSLFLHQVSKSNAVSKPHPIITDDNTSFKGKRILVVDDEIRNVFALAQMLEERDIEVLEAENGKEAIDLLKEDKQIDLILMDIMMPVMDGYEAMQHIRKTPDIKNIPIICLTAKAMKEDREIALKNGANDYLSKPLDENKLFSMLKIWLHKK